MSIQSPDATERASCVFIWTDMALFIGPRSATDIHAHHALEVCLALDDTIDIRGAEESSFRRCAGALVPSDTRHQLTIHGPRVAIIYIDPFSRLGDGLAQALTEPTIRPVPDRVVRAHRSQFIDLLTSTDSDAAAEVCASVLDQLALDRAEGAGPRPVDPRVTRAMQLIEAALDSRIVAADLAASLALSESRFLHIFREQAGLPLRRYVLWTRLRRALTLALAGDPMTTAAHASGFADSAHLTRTCRQMFGLPPSAFAPVDTLVIVRA